MRARYCLLALRLLALRLLAPSLLALRLLALRLLAPSLLASCLFALHAPSAWAQAERAHGEGALFAGPVGMELARVSETWHRNGTVSALSPRLLTRGTSVDLGLPAAAIDPSTPDCATLLVLGSPSAVFSLGFDRSDGDVRRDFPLESSVGLLQVARCGARKVALSRASLHALSPRTVLSLLLVVGEVPAVSSLELLPGRRAGPPSPALELGPRPGLMPAADRLAAKRRTRTLDQPSSLVEGTFESDATGSVRQRWSLAAGCHDIDVLETSESAGSGDVDARVLGDGGQTLAVDDSTAPEAHLSLCVGEVTAAVLDVRGAEPAAPLAWLHASWSLPEGLPIEWGPRARGRLADTLQSEHFPLPPSRPIASSLGVQGTTRMTLPARPGACYLAAAAALGREPERLGLAARAGGRTSRTRARPGRTSASVTLCATGPELTVEVQSIGAGADWIVGVWDFEQVPPP